MDPLLESLSALKREIGDQPELLEAIDSQIQEINAWVAEKQDDEPKTERAPRVFGEVDAKDQVPAQSRGIFDDIDE
jgi:hypothetical protein